MIGSKLAAKILNLMRYHLVNSRCKKFKNSEIEFYLTDAFEIYHFMPIYFMLLEQGFKVGLVAEPGCINTVGNWFDYNEAVKILQQNCMDYYTKANAGAKIAITTQYASLLKKYKNKKVSLSYGFGLNKDNFAHTERATKGLTARLVHGEFSRQQITRYMAPENIYAVGFPKHDHDLVNHEYQKETILNKYNIKTDKPVLLYLPTWDEDASIKKYAPAFKNLKEKFFLLVKPHHCTARLREKWEDLDILKNLADYLLDGNSLFSEAVFCADIVVADAKSGAGLEAIYLKSVPAVFISLRERTEDDYYDYLFKIGGVITEPGTFQKKVIDAYENEKVVDNQMVEFIYGLRDGKSTERSVDALKCLLPILKENI